MDNLCSSDSAVVVRYGYCVYDGRSDPYSARNCCNNGAGTHHSREEDCVGCQIPACDISFKKKKAHHGAPFFV